MSPVDTASAGGGDGPIPVRNHHPLYTRLLYPPPEMARISPEPGFTVSINHTSLYTIERGEEWAMAMDKELTEAGFSFRLPFGQGRAEAGLYLPVCSSSAGFMDEFVRWWHGRIGAWAGAPDYRYLDTVYHNGKRSWEGEPGRLLPGDVDLALKAAVWRRSVFSLSAQALAQAPTGNANRGAGSGSWGFGARLLADADFDVFSVYFGGGMAEPGEVRAGGETISLSRMYLGFISINYRIGRRLRLVAQSMFNTSPLGSADIGSLRKSWRELTLGLKYPLGDGHILALGLSENLNGTGPDFTIHLSLEKRGGQD